MIEGNMSRRRPVNRMRPAETDAQTLGYSETWTPRHPEPQNPQKLTLGNPQQNAQTHVETPRNADFQITET
eukprot:5067896-Pyramimonas_sp.AAC.1